MKIIHWNSAYRVGVEIIDQQHQTLISIYNELVSCLESDRLPALQQGLLQRLRDYVHYHFSYEEELLRAHPRFAEHAAAHQKIEEQVLLIQNRCLEQGTLLTVEDGHFMHYWVREHILGEDVRYFRDLGFPEAQEEVPGQLSPFLEEKPRIILAEDAEDQRMLLRLVLEREGYDVLEAENGHQALELCNRYPDIRLLVTDLKMPEMDGFALIRELRRSQLHYTYVIVVSSLYEKGDLVEALSCGANDFLTKPVFPEELALRLQGGRQLLRLESQDELILSLARIADCRSHETGLHIERTRAYVGEIARYLSEQVPALGLQARHIAMMELAAPLHDIGKVAISDAILGKPGRLTPEEFELMKEHSNIGGSLLNDIFEKTGWQAMRMASEIAMCHHERWDGAGYPVGLSGVGIPLAARIMALADVYDALTSHRVYKRAYSHDEARTLIVEGRGTQFDPQVVDAFLALEERFLALHRELSDEDGLSAEGKSPAWYRYMSSAGKFTP